MNQKHILREDVQYLLFAEIYQRYQSPKTKRRAFSLVEAAISCFDRKGFEHVTLEMIAREAGVTRPLLHHYFEDLDEVRDLSLKYIRLIGQKLVIDAMGKAKDPSEVLESYLRAHFQWANSFKGHMRTWLSFLSWSARSKNRRTFNSLTVRAGTERLAHILRNGRKAGIFGHTDDLQTAHLMQTFMLGWLVCLATEELNDRESFSKEVIEQCLAMVRRAN